MTLGGPRSVQSNDRQTVQSVLGDLRSILLREMVLFEIMVGCLTTFTLTLVSIHGFKNDKSLGKGFRFSRFYSATCRGIRSVDHWCHSHTHSFLTFFSHVVFEPAFWSVPLTLCTLTNRLLTNAEEFTSCQMCNYSSTPGTSLHTKEVSLALHWCQILLYQKIFSKKISFFSLWFLVSPSK